MNESILDWLGVSGVLAIIGGIVAHARQSQRVDELEKKAERSAENGERLARVEAKLDLLIDQIGGKK